MIFADVGRWLIAPGAVRVCTSLAHKLPDPDLLGLLLLYYVCPLSPPCQVSCARKLIPTPHFSILVAKRLRLQAVIVRQKI